MTFEVRERLRAPGTRRKRRAGRGTPDSSDDECLRDALGQIIDADVPPLPVIDAAGKQRGIVGERVLIVPIVDVGRVTPFVSREDFTRALARRLLTLS